MQLDLGHSFMPMAVHSGFLVCHGACGTVEGLWVSVTRFGSCKTLENRTFFSYLIDGRALQSFDQYLIESCLEVSIEVRSE